MARPRKTPDEVYAEAVEQIRWAALRNSASLNLGKGRRSLTKIPSLSGLTSLRNLEIRYGRVTDIAPLAALSTLESLTLTETLVADVKPISNLTELKHLSLWDSPVKSVAPLANLKKLKHLNLARTSISNVEALSNLKELEFLDISSTRVTDIRPLAKLKNLVFLEIDNLELTTLAPLARLSNLRQINLSGTRNKISLKPLANLKKLNRLDLSNSIGFSLVPLGGCESLKELDLSRSHINSLSGLANIRSLQQLQISGTQITDLSPLAALSSLKRLSAYSTDVANLSPLSSLDGLEFLDLDDTRVTDISPLGNLQNLIDLKLDGTGLSDIEALARSTSLIKGAREHPWHGLSMRRCRFLSSELVEIASYPNPKRTIAAINSARKDVHLPPIPEEESDSEIPPDLPAQGPGPHFLISEGGILEFAPPAELDHDGNNIQRLNDLHPILKEAAKNLVSAVSPNQHPQLREIASQYLSLIEKNLNELSFAQLYGLGLRLQSAASAAERKVEDRIVPELDDPAKEALESVIALHGPFILASAEGSDLLADAERYARKPEDEERFRKAAVELGEKLKESDSLADNNAANFIADTATEIGQGAQSRRVALTRSQHSRMLPLYS